MHIDWSGTLLVRIDPNASQTRDPSRLARHRTAPSHVGSDGLADRGRPEARGQRGIDPSTRPPRERLRLGQIRLHSRPCDHQGNVSACWTRGLVSERLAQNARVLDHSSVMAVGTAQRAWEGPSGQRCDSAGIRQDQAAKPRAAARRRSARARCNVTRRRRPPPACPFGRHGGEVWSRDSRKRLLSAAPRAWVEAFLRAERVGAIVEVPGGWLIEGRFSEALPSGCPPLRD